jgi:hypothetical protein
MLPNDRLGKNRLPVCPRGQIADVLEPLAAPALANPRWRRCRGGRGRRRRARACIPMSSAVASRSYHALSLRFIHNAFFCDFVTLITARSSHRNYERSWRATFPHGEMSMSKKPWVKPRYGLCLWCKLRHARPPHPCPQELGKQCHCCRLCERECRLVANHRG